MVSASHRIAEAVRHRPLSTENGAIRDLDGPTRSGEPNNEQVRDPGEIPAPWHRPACRDDRINHSAISLRYSRWLWLLQLHIQAGERVANGENFSSFDMSFQRCLSDVK